MTVAPADKGFFFTFFDRLGFPRVVFGKLPGHIIPLGNPLALDYPFPFQNSFSDVV